jgi:uncharacterized protein (DUF362 family)
VITATETADRLVAMVLLEGATAGYPEAAEAYGPDESFPELPHRGALSRQNLVYRAVRDLFREARLDAERYGTPRWNPLGAVIQPGDTVAVKPNWVSNPTRETPATCLVTHPSVVRAVLDYVLLAQPRRVVIGDAPVQRCDLPALLSAAGYDAVRRHYEREGARLEWRDFRRTTLSGPVYHRARRSGLLPIDEFITFDVGAQSVLEEVTDNRDRFRVTMYDPDRLPSWHRKNEHRYLVSRAVLEADVVIGMPKLKTHAKAGLTGALKNSVGINGNKEYLPHHRLGGPRQGGDCYPEDSRLKALAERLLDASNRRGGPSAALFYWASRAVVRAAALAGASLNLEGSWHGNDTVWRMCLDLNRILMFGRPDGRLADSPQRKLVFVTDGIIAGEGNGPLNCRPRTLGAITFARNPVAADYVHAHLMGFDWTKIPLIREALAGASPIAAFAADEVEALVGDRRLAQPWPRWRDGAFEPAPGWRGCCERETRSGR